MGIEKLTDPETVGDSSTPTGNVVISEGLINASGHRQELDRNFRFVNICGLGITTGNTWLALGGTIVTAIYNGGPPGVIYELIAASFFYWLIATSIAELCSAMPSSGGGYSLTYIEPQNHS